MLKFFFWSSCKGDDYDSDSRWQWLNWQMVESLTHPHSSSLFSLAISETSVIKFNKTGVIILETLMIKSYLFQYHVKNQQVGSLMV